MLNEEFNLRYKDGEISKEKYKITKLGFQYYNRSYKQWFSSVGLEDILCGNCTIVKFLKIQRSSVYFLSLGQLMQLRN